MQTRQQRKISGQAEIAKLHEQIESQPLAVRNFRAQNQREYQKRVAAFKNKVAKETGREINLTELKATSAKQIRGLRFSSRGR